MEDQTGAPIQHPVSIWEGIAVIAGAILLVIVGLAGLGVKAINNAYNPGRAEAIAHSLVGYSFPSASKGLFGTTIGSGKMAVVASTDALQASIDASGNSVQLPTIELFVAQIPGEEKADPPDSEADPSVSPTFFSGFSFSYQTEGAFHVARSRTENRLFCGTLVPVTIQEGTLTLSDQKPPLPAIRYEAYIKLNAETRVAILSTVGQEAEKNASRVFRSLNCQQ